MGRVSHDVQGGATATKEAVGRPRYEVCKKLLAVDKGAGAVRSKNWSVKKLFGERF